jgi:hypothetical protein
MIRYEWYEVWLLAVKGLAKGPGHGEEKGKELRMQITLPRKEKLSKSA